MNSEKVELRKKLKQLRYEFSDGEHTLKSRAVVDRLITEVDWSKFKTVHYFEPIQELLEVDISDLVTYLEDSFPDIQLFAPRLINGEWEMISIKDKSAPDKFDAVIVPMLGFDKALNRIGYGGGYYDKFLASQPDALKIGVCFESGRVEQIPTEPHDIPLDLIVTEDKVYHR